MSTQFDATASMLGYLYQVRFALLDSLRRLRSFGSFKVSIETLDDVAFETTSGASALDLLQTKHHLAKVGSLTDASVDLWKSVRIWCDAFKKARWSDDAVQYLVTTSAAPSGSAASYLKGTNRDVNGAIERLNGTARTSTNEENLKAYAAYSSLTDDDRQAIFGRVVVVDSAPTIVGIEERLKEELALLASRELIGALLSRLEGWWFQRVIAHLAKPGTFILSEEIDAELDRLRQQFRKDNLPIDADLLAYEVIDESAFASFAFVEQLRLIDISTKRILTAMRQYFRASEQRSRWLREGFLHLGELKDYDRRLCEEWDTRFAIMIQQVGEPAAETAMREAARRLYEWAELEKDLLIRPACTEPFVSRGSLQMLSDSGEVGWHPQFSDRLRHLLKKAS